MTQKPLIDDMEHAYRHALGDTPSLFTLMDLRDEGWTLETINLVGACMRYAVEQRTALAYLAPGSERDMKAGRELLALRESGHDLVLCLRAWRDEPGYVRSIHAWLPSIAAVPYGDGLLPLLAVGITETRMPSLRRTWTRWVGYRHAPLAYAAGIPLAEARRMSSENRLDVESLQVMAALRGRVLPSV